MALHTYLPQDRLRALAKGEALPDRANGTALFADISGFTKLTQQTTHELGARRGIEEVAQKINVVYDELIKQVEYFGGSVVSFAGDAITCWFDETIGDSALNAVACAQAMQTVMQKFPDLGVKVAVCTGPARRFVVGDPEIQLIDALAGNILIKLSIAEQLAESGEIIFDLETVNKLNLPKSAQRVSETGEIFYVSQIPQQLIKQCQENKTNIHAEPLQIDNAILKKWIPPIVYEKENTGHELFLTELRPTVALFMRFEGIDYDNDPLAETQLNTIISKTQRILAQHEGSLLELTIGDKGSYIYASFGVTHIHENDAQRAVRAAVEIKETLGVDASQETLQFGLSSGTMRVGGYGSSTRKTFSAIGSSVNLSARLMMAAEPGEILISGRVQKSNKGQFAVDARPPMSMKGWAEPVLVFSVQGMLKQRAIRLREPVYQLPIIGREKELELIAHRLESTINGQGQIIGVTGEAGMGKSRLIAEGIRLAQRNKFMGYGGTCQSDRVNIPYTVWNSIWNAFFDLDPAMSLKKQVRILEGELEDRAAENIDALPILGSVLGLPIPDNDFTHALQPADRKAQLETVLLKILESFAREAAEDNGGLLLVLEDLHWIDPVSLDLLVKTAKIIESLPVLILLTFRPTDMDSREQSLANLTSLKHYTHIKLTELNTAESEQAIRAKLAHLYPEQREGIPGILIERVTSRAQGNPFYMEELLNYMHDRGVDLRDPTALNNLELPTSLHSLVLSRIDHLTASQQLALKAASIIGRVFQFEHLRSYYPALGTAEKVKADLQATEQLDLTPIESIEPELIYLFKHLVTHEVSYESIAYSARAKLHGQYAQYLENAYTDNTDKVAAQLAYHYEKAEIKEKARSYLIKAGEQAASNYANEDALSYFNRALKLTPDARSRNHFDILMKRERVYDLLGRRSEQRQDLELLEQSVSNFDDAVSLRSQIANRRAKLEIDEGDYAAANLIAGATAKELTNAVQKQADLSELLVDTLLIEARTMFLLGKASAASPQLESALSLAREHQYIRGEYNALAQLALLNWHNGDNTTAVELMEHSIELIRKAGDIRRESEILNNLGIVTKDMYRFDDALAYYERAQKITRKIGDRSGEASLLNNMGRASFASGKLAHAIEYCTQAETLAIETNDLAVRALALHNKSEAFRELGQYVSAKKAAEESIKYLKSAGYQVGEAYALENLAMTEFSLGEHVNALEHAEQALQITQAIEARRVEVSILTRLGLMHLGLNQLDLAEEALLSAQKIEGEFNEATPVFEIQAGLSNVALARGDSETIQKAQATIQNLADELLKEPVTDLAHVLPLWMYETCIRAMKAGDDMGVEKMIKRANEELHLRAKKITDEALRESFLNVGENLSIAASSER